MADEKITQKIIKLGFYCFHIQLDMIKNESVKTQISSMKFLF